MDERLEKALSFSDYRTTINNRKAAIRRRFETMLVVHYNNGMFIASKTTVAFVQALLSLGQKDSIIIDENGQPVDVTDLVEFQEKLLHAYHTATNEYSTEMKKLAKARNVKSAMEW